MSQGTLTFTVGRMLCGSVRDFLKETRFRGAAINWIESSGRLERQFVVRGDYETLDRMRSSIVARANEINREEG